MSLKEDFADRIIGFYTRNGFGRVFKAEIDIAFFHYYLLENLKQKYLSEGKVKYFHIDKSEIYRLSLQLGMTETKFKRLLEDDYFLNKADVTIENFLLDMINSRTIQKNALLEGKLRLLIPNPVTKKFLEERMYSSGGVIEYGQNQEIMIIEIYDFLKLIQFTEETELAGIIRENILAKADIDGRNPEIKAFFETLNAVPIEERLKKIALGFADKYTGKGGTEILGAIFDAAAKGKR